MGTVVRSLVVLVALGVLGAYVVLDDPGETARQAWSSLKLRLNPPPPPPPSDGPPIAEAPAMLPGVSVYLIDKNLATREGRQLAVLADVWFYCYDPTGEVFRIPAGFETDFASIPAWAHRYVRPNDRRVIGAAIVHDWLYALGGQEGVMTKRKADQIFRFALKEKGVNRIKRNVMFQAVSAFGNSFGSPKELRFRDIRTGKLVMGDPNEEAVVPFNLGPGCPDFLKLFSRLRESEDGTIPLHPGLLKQWIDLG